MVPEPSSIITSEAVFLAACSFCTSTFSCLRAPIWALNEISATYVYEAVCSV